MKEMIKNIDFKQIDKLTLEKCMELEVIPIEIEKKVIILCKYIDEEAKETIRLIFDEIKIKIITEEEFEEIKKVIFINNKNLESEIIGKAIAEGVSDIHCEIEKTGVNIKYRIDGLLNIRYKISKEVYNKFLSRIKIKSNLDIAEKRRPQDGKFKYETLGKEVNLRVSVINTINGEKLVIRILRDALIREDYRDLISIEKQKEVLNKIVKRKNGLVIINGPTGSGKSTTLYSILEISKKENVNITTIEDPVEVSIEGITQIQLNSEIGLDFSVALKSVLRQDPDIIMVGEIRDKETAKIAVRASITGHKVYTTVHSISGREVLYRLKDLDIDEGLLKQALVGIVSQKLIRKLCNSCREKINVSLKGENLIVYEKKGCKACNYSGNKGRTLVTQIYKLDRNFDFLEIEKNKEHFSNKEMKDVAFEYLRSGHIGYSDYLEFIEEQEG
ncbi:MAG: GspE/PulE family protein [Clostridium sp.]|uniref:GspE/PulE family protein n=1 Tax=Clostridium sp. TaxID=1506 RepID=UPI003EE57F79